MFSPNQSEQKLSKTNLAITSFDHDESEKVQIDASRYTSKLKACISASRLIQEDIIVEEGIKTRQMVQHDFSREFFLTAEGIEPEPDVMAKLVCEINDLGTWELRLNEIKGSKVIYLFGKSFNSTDTLELDSLIPGHQQKKHHARVISILNEGPSSKYWSFLFDGMMSRTIKIVNPHNQTPRLVKIHMTMNSNDFLDSNRYVFNITLTDQTAMHAVATKAGQLTHDLRGYMRSGINTIIGDKVGYTREEFIQLVPQLSPEALGRMYDLQKENDTQAIELFNEGLKLCSNTREDFFPDSIIQQSISEHSDGADDEVFVDVNLQDFIRKMRATTTECGLSYFGDTSSKLGSSQFNILEHFLLNLIRNAIQAGARQIDVKSAYETDMLTVEVTDNGKGMPSNLLKTFFTRAMPQRALGQSPGAIEDNRGEGTLMSNESWESIGGKSVVMPRQDGQSGTTFRLSIVSSYHQFFTQAECSFSSEQKTSLADLATMETLDGIILLVDDSLTIMKMLLKQVTNILCPVPLPWFETLKSVVSEEWQKKGFVIEIRGGWGIVCAANGRVAYDIVKRSAVRATITDHEMPIMNGIDLIASIRNMERKESRPRMSIALNSALLATDLTAKKSSDIDLYILKGEITDMRPFFAKIIDNCGKLGQGKAPT